MGLNATGAVATVGGQRRAGGRYRVARRAIGPTFCRSRGGGTIDESPDVFQLIDRAQAGSTLDADQLFSVLYQELHRLAERQLRREGADLSIGPTTLLHEAWLDMSGRGGTTFPDRGRFMAYAARAMRALIVDYARRSRAQKRGGRGSAITLTSDESANDQGLRLDPRALEGLSDALEELADVDPQLAQLVDLHFFCGFSLPEIAEHRSVAPRTVQRDWQKARLLLHRFIQEG